MLGTAGYGQVLAAGASYTETVNVRVPDGIQGTFDIIVYADSDASHQLPVAEQHRLRPLRRADRRRQRAGPLRPGLRRRSAAWAAATFPSTRTRPTSSPRSPMPVTLAPAPDLQVTAISSDANAGHVFQGQTLDVTYTVTNTGAAHAADDADLGRPDLLLGRHQPRPEGRHATWGWSTHQNGLGAGASYTVTTQVQVPTEPERSVLPLRDHRPAHRQPHRQGVRRGRRRTRTTTACTSPRRWSSTRRRPRSSWSPASPCPTRRR